MSDEDPKLKFYYVTVQMTYVVEVEAPNADEAEAMVEDMDAAEIHKEDLQDFKITNTEGPA